MAHLEDSLNDAFEIDLHKRDWGRALEALKRAEQVARDSNAEISVSIWWEPEGGQSGFDFDSALLTRLSALGTRVSVYFPGAQGEE